MQHSIQKNIDEIIARFSQENKADFVGFQERFSREIERILDEIKAKSPPLTNEEYQKIFTFPLQQRQNLMQQVVGEERKERLVQALDSVEDPVTKEILLERIYEQIEHFGKIQKLSSNLYLARTGNDLETRKDLRGTLKDDFFKDTCRLIFSRLPHFTDLNLFELRGVLKDITVLEICFEIKPEERSLFLKIVEILPIHTIKLSEKFMPLDSRLHELLESKPEVTTLIINIDTIRGYGVTEFHKLMQAGKNIRRLNVNVEYTQKIDGLEALCGSAPLLESLTISGCSFQSKDLQLLSKVFKSLPALKSFGIYLESGSKIDCHDLKNILASASNLRYLSISGIQSLIDKENLKELFSGSLSNLKYLTLPNLQDFQTGTDWIALCEALPKGLSGLSIACSINFPTKEHLKYLQANGKNLSHLELSGARNLVHLSAEELKDFLGSFPKLRSLSLKHLPCGKWSEENWDVFTQFPRIQRLNLSNCDLGYVRDEKKIAHIGKALGHLTILEIIGDTNIISDPTMIKPLYKPLKNLMSIRVPDYQKNEIMRLIPEMAEKIV